MRDTPGHFPRDTMLLVGGSKSTTSKMHTSKQMYSIAGVRPFMATYRQCAGHAEKSRG